MKGICRTLLLAGAGSLALGLLSHARADVVIYQGQPAQSSGLKLQSWGSGEAADTEEYVFTGVKSIKVKTHGRYQGARLVLSKPADVKEASSDPRMYLEMAVMVPERQTTSRTGGGMMGPGGGMMGPGLGSGGMMGPGGGRSGSSSGRGGMMGPGGGMMGPGGGMTGPGGSGRGGMTGPGGSGRGGMTGPGGSGRGGAGGMMGPGGSGRGGAGGDTSGGAMGPGGSGGMNDTARSLLVEPKNIKSVRAVLVTTDGKQIEVTLPMEYSRANREGWRTLSVPLAALPALKNTSGEIAEIRLFGDSIGTMYVGQIRTVQDDTPIRVAELPERTVAVNDTIKFTGSAEAGVSQLKYEWTVVKAGERPDPLPVDAEGKTFEHKFRKSGEYEVILTVRDVYGRKKPATAVAKVRVTL
jgi:hypothetical protein